MWNLSKSPLFVLVSVLLSLPSISFPQTSQHIKKMGNNSECSIVYKMAEMMVKRSDPALAKQMEAFANGHGDAAEVYKNAGNISDTQWAQLLRSIFSRYESNAQSPNGQKEILKKMDECREFGKSDEITFNFIKLRLSRLER